MSVLRGKPSWRGSKSTDNVVNCLTVGLQDHTGVVFGCGTPASPKTSSLTDRNFMSCYFSASGATGTTRGLYLRLYLTGGAGGEAIRAFNTVSNNAPVDTVNGIHASLNFGASAGNVTGLGTAGRFTLHGPNRALTGTTAAIQAEAYLDGTSSDFTGTHSLIRAIVAGGNQAARRKFKNLMEVSCETGAYNAGYMHATTNSGTIAEALRILVNGNVRYIPLISSLVAP